MSMHCTGGGARACVRACVCACAQLTATDSATRSSNPYVQVSSMALAEAGGAAATDEADVAAEAEAEAEVVAGSVRHCTGVAAQTLEPRWDEDIMIGSQADINSVRTLQPSLSSLGRSHGTALFHCVDVGPPQRLCDACMWHARGQVHHILVEVLDSDCLAGSTHSHGVVRLPMVSALSPLCGPRPAGRHRRSCRAVAQYS
jgi:hypothetical protein